MEFSNIERQGASRSILTQEVSDLDPKKNEKIAR
jgi:hypothetical protein